MFSSITRFVSSFVYAIWQTTVFSGGVSVEKLKGVTVSSPSCTSVSEKSILLLSTRAGVPVLKRRSGSPSLLSESPSSVAGKLPSGPDG